MIISGNTTLPGLLAQKNAKVGSRDSLINPYQRTYTLGVKTQKVRCVLVSSGEAVDDGNCTGLAKLEPRTQPCNTPCPAK